MTKQETKQNKKDTDFFISKEVSIELSQSDILEIIHSLNLTQKEYGFDAPNQQPTRLQEVFRKLKEPNKEDSK
ncbi:MAG: hypothetical protein KKF56_05690 [Nanoarchaeota archaeon]|nr:hypothetical protein [Nanoarchaeota archaeon]